MNPCIIHRKTICLCNRIDYDRRLWLGAHPVGNAAIPKLSQLFVARSNRICNYVRGIVDGENGEVPKETTYSTFTKVLTRITNALATACPGNIQHRKPISLFLDTSRRVSFSRYKREIYKSEFGLDALVIWTQVRSFIKGSIEAVMAGRPLSESEYMNLGENRCRLSQRQRKLAYIAYVKYQQYLDQGRLWDSCDRVGSLLRCIRSTGFETRNDISFNKVYVDEVQDYTQAEIALFFMLCDRGGLFLAGDTAQSVVEGVEFRWEEVRSVGHHFNDIPEKPVTVNTNFRSHSGILNLAAAILERMFAVFPRSANKLKPDIGLFVGPRPGIFQNISMASVKELVSLIEGVVILTHDNQVDRWQDFVGDEAIVLGIREAKGLEFPTVIIINAFLGLAGEHHKPWRDILSIRESGQNGHDIKQTVPECETQLKLLYTAITRCSKRLFFIETKPSVAGNAFVKYVTVSGLAVPQQVDAVDKTIKTADEWRSSGVDYGSEAESSEDAERARKWMLRAIRDFDKGGDTNNKRKAEVHLSSIDLRIELESKYQNLLFPGCSHSKKSVNPELDLIERKSSMVLAKLIDERLLQEARKLCTVCFPLLPGFSRRQLMRKVGVLDFLPDDEE